MSMVVEKPVGVGRRPSIPFAAIGARAARQTSQKADSCPCCGAALPGGLLKVDLNTNTMIIDKTVIKLKPREVDVLSILAKRYPGVVTHDALISGYWGDSETDGAYCSIKVYMSVLNKKLAGTRASIVNTHSVGYRLVLA